MTYEESVTYLNTMTDQLIERIGGQLSESNMNMLSLNEHCLLAYRYLRDEVMEGGFIQLIQNGYGPYVLLGPFPMLIPVSVDAPLGHRTNMSLLSVLVNKDAPLADERVHSEAIEDAIEYALGTLDDRERRVVNAFFGINQEHETMAEIAEDMELKRERVRQIRDKSVRKLRKAYRNKLRSL